ncbi:MAG: hypothetical protein HC889_18195 [Synechococcaceae cyanobacterium SM1_2_3]|nr:hypothetical protein [Synechococcaceae cyanobacterium SM1_2_3]
MLIQGAAWEVRAPNAPQRISLSDGYLTVDFGHWHFHLCIGEYRGPRNNPASAELARHRRTAAPSYTAACVRMVVPAVGDCACLTARTSSR